MKRFSLIFPPATRSQPAGADPAGAIPVVVEARDRHVLAGLPGVDEPAVADIDAVVAEAIEEDEVAGLEAVARDRCAQLVLGRGVVRQRHADPRVYVAHEARAIEVRRPLAAPAIRRAAVLQGDLHHARARR